MGHVKDNTHFKINHADEMGLMTLFTQLMLERGYLAFNQFKPSFAHQEEHVEGYLATASEVFPVMAHALENGGTETLLKGPKARRGFYRLT